MAEAGRGKTDTIKARGIYVYLPSLEMVEDWKHRAKKSGTSISKFVIERVEDSLRREEGEEGYLSRLELIERVNTVEGELKALRDENRLLRRLVDNLENELKRYRAKPFLEEGFEGVRSFDKDLVSILRRGGTYSDDAILAALNIDQTDVELVKAVSRQMEALENYGLVEFTRKGWKWKE